MKNLIIVDIETSGLDRTQCAVLSIGAIDFNSDKEFYIECKTNRKHLIEEKALELNGFTHEQIFDEAKPTGREAYKKFEEWAYSIYEQPILGGENIGQFDAMFLCRLRNNDFSLNWPFKHRFVDLHSIMYFITKKSMSLQNMAKYFHLEPENEVHNALNGAKKAKEILQACIFAAERNDSIYETTWWHPDYYRESPCNFNVFYNSSLPTIYPNGMTGN